MAGARRTDCHSQFANWLRNDNSRTAAARKQNRTKFFLYAVKARGVLPAGFDRLLCSSGCWIYAELDVAQRERAAWMNPSEFAVRSTAAIGILRNIDFAFDKFGMAPAAFSASAVRRGPDAGLLHRPKEGFLCLARYGGFLAPNIHGQKILFSLLLLGEVGVFRCLQIVSGHLHAIPPFG